MITHENPSRSRGALGLHGFSGADRGGGILHLRPSDARAPPRLLSGLTLSTAMQALDYRIPKDDQRVEAPLWPISRAQLNVAFAVAAGVLSAASLFVVFQGANDEPYMAYRRYDAIVQVGVGTALIVLWGLCSITVMILVGKRKLSPAWIALLLWAAICLFYLSYSPIGYLEDIERHVIPAAKGGG